MRILMVNWARLPDGPRIGGGVNGYQRELAIELARLGHDVTAVSSGMAYVPDAWPHQSWPHDWDRPGALASIDHDHAPLHPGPCTLRRMPDFVHHDPRTRPIAIYEILNSPVVAPALFQFRDPRRELGAPDLERAFASLLGQLRPEVVHAQSLEGFSAGCLDAARIAGARVVFSLHNYHTLCPQVYLMRGGRTPCRDFENGHACLECFDAPHREGEIRARLEGYWREHADLVVLSLNREPLRPRPIPTFPTSPVAPGPEADVFEPLTNTLAPPPRSPLPPNDYALRRRAMIDLLNRCDRVLAVSTFVRDLYASVGVQPQHLAVLPIGTRLAPPDERPPRRLGPPGVLRLAFVGFHNHYKGLHVLVAALERLPADLRARVDLAVHAKDVDPIRPRLESLRPTLHDLRVEGDYRHDQLPTLLADRDIGVVPSVWWDNGPQTVLEFLAAGLPVLGADVGGIPDQVTHEQSGLLFTANDPGALAHAIARLLREPALLPSLRANVRPPKDIAAHAREVEAEYRALLARPHAPQSPETAPALN